METPDRWVICKITDKAGNQVQFRVLAGWYGGYCGSDEWKMSSHIMKIEEQTNFWDVHTDSGNLYRCYKVAEGMSSYMSSVYRSYEKTNTEDLFIKISKPGEFK